MFFITIWSLKRFWIVILSESLTRKNLTATLTSDQPLRSEAIHPRDTYLLLTDNRCFTGGKSSSWYSVGIFLDNVWLRFWFSLPHVVLHVNSNWIQKLKSPVRPPHLSLPQMWYCPLQKHLSHLKCLYAVRLLPLGRLFCSLTQLGNRIISPVSRIYFPQKIRVCLSWHLSSTS